MSGSGLDDETMNAAMEAADYDPNAPKVHVLRAQLPWRVDAGVTECGRVPGPNTEVMTREQAAAAAKKWGQRRSALMFCITCRDHTYAWLTWERSPVAVVARECQRGGGTLGRFGDDAERSRLDFELRALGLLVEAHRAEYDATLSALRDTTDLAQRRARRA